MKLALVRRKHAATGGAELYLDRLLRALAVRGHELHLFAEDWPQPPSGVTLHTMTVTGSRSVRPRRFALAVQEALARQSFDCVFSLERTLRQDVYRAGDGVHARWLGQRRRFAPWWRRPFVGFGAFHRNLLNLERRTFDPANTRYVIANSHRVAREIHETFSFPSDRIHLVRNGVDVARFRDADGALLRRTLGLNAGQRLLLFVGSGWERKGLAFLLKAMRSAALADTTLLVVGKGTPPSGSPPNVRFAGQLAAVEQAYAAADLFVFLPIYEPSANVCLEALAAGLPVVTTRFNGAAESIDERVTGTVLDDPRDTPAVIDAVRFWLDRTERRIATDLEPLSLDRNVNETLAVLERASEARPRPGQPRSA